MRAHAASGVRVFVVWEPVLVTDWGRPSPALTTNIRDARATHFWDAGRRLSAMYGGSGKLDTLADNREVNFRMKDVVWDAALVYPPGARWGAKAKLLVAPVVGHRAEIAGAL